MLSCLPSAFVLLYFTTSVLSADKIPGDIKPCRSSDPNLIKCIQRSMTDALSNFRKGNKELNIGSIDPLLLENIDLVHSRTSRSMQVTLKLVSAKCYGISKASFKNTKIKTEGNQHYMETTSIVPNVTVDGKYELKGKLLLLPINALDRFRVELYNLTSSEKLMLVPEVINGVEYYKVKDAVLTIDSIAGSKSNYENIVAGNKELSDQLNKQIQEDFLLLFDLYRPPLSQVFTGIYSQLAARIFSKIPADTILPP